MALVIGLAVRGAKAAHKAHKKHQAEKELREQGMLDEVRHSSQGFEQPQQNSRSNRDIKHTYTHRNSSASSIDSAEAEAQLEHDPDYQRFIERQKQMYLDQRRSLGARGSGSARRAEFDQSRMYPSAQPPAYDTVVAENTSVQRAERTSCGPAQVNQTPLAEVSDPETYAVSPVATINTRWDSRNTRVEEAEPVSPVSPVGPYSSTIRYQGEMANTRV